MNRFKWWAMSLFSSIFVCVSLGYNFYENKSFEKNEIQTLCLYSSTIILSGAGLIVSIFCKGTKIKPWLETILVLLNLIVWIMVGIATLIGTSNFLKRLSIGGLALDSTNDRFEISEPNVYFFSFGSLFLAVYLTSSWFKQYVLKDENALTTTQWTFLLTSGFLVMATGISLYDKAFCGGDSYYSCGRTTLSIVVGFISGVTGCILLPWRSAPLVCQAELALILLVTWATAIALLTFGTGPAVYINTMYFGTLLSFFLALDIFTTTMYADSVLQASPYSQIEFGRTESQRADGEHGAAGFLDMAYANIMRQSSDEDSDNDVRHDDGSTAMLFESVGGSVSSLDNRVSSLQQTQDEREFNRKVIVGKHDFSRIEIWFLFFVESSMCVAVFNEQVDTNESLMEQWIFLSPGLSILISIVGWFTCSIKNKIAYCIEGILILTCILLWIRGLIAVTTYFTDDTTDEGGMGIMTANQLFMSYGSFFTSLYLITNWSKASVTTTDWIFLSATSGTIFGVLMIGHDRIFRKCDWSTEFQSCGDLQLVTTLAFGSACISFAMVLVTFVSCGKLGPLVHVTIGSTLMMIWCVGAYYIVFEKEGTGKEIGPTFFACWGSLFFCVDITSTNLVMLFKKEQSDDEVESGPSSQDHDESFGDEEENQIVFNTSDDVDTNDYDCHHKIVSEHQTEDKILRIITENLFVDNSDDDEDVFTPVFPPGIK